MNDIVKGCIACHGNLRFFGKRSGYDYMQCTACKTIQLYPIPSTERVEKAYSHEYADAGHYPYADAAIRESEPFSQALADLSGSIAPKGTVLDFGCGYGGLSRALAARKRPYLGVDLSIPMVEYCKAHGLNASNASISTLLEEKAAFSAIAMNAVLEHLTNPEYIFTELRRLLMPGGYIISSSVTGPFPTFFGKWLMRLSGGAELPRMRNIFVPPWHVVFYTPAGMRELAPRCGSSLEKVVPISFGAMPGVMGLLRPAASAVGALGFHLLSENWPLCASHIFCLKRVD